MKLLCVVVLTLQSVYLYAQLNDSLLLRRAQFNLEQNRIHHLALYERPNSLSPHKLVLPVGMLSYGFLSLKSALLQQANHEIQEEIQEHSAGFRTNFDNYLQFAPAAAVYALNASGVKGRHNLKDRSIILGTSFILSTAAVFALKKITHQLRPDYGGYSSFPSGHTSTAFTGAEFMLQEYKGYSPLLRYSGYVMAAGTGVLRMYNNRHWLSDVITGAGVGILSTKLSYWLFESVKKKVSKAPIRI